MISNLNLMRLLTFYSEDHYRHAFYTNLTLNINETPDYIVTTVSTDDGETLELRLDRDSDYIVATINISIKTVFIDVAEARNDAERAVEKMWQRFYS